MAGRVEAVVQADGAETRYVSCGRGAPLVVVAFSESSRRRLGSVLTGEYRVIEPVVPVMGAETAVAGEELGRWLLGFIDGLGLSEPTVLLAGELAPMMEGVSLLLAAAEATVLLEATRQY
jgi:hypothetical protein